jgi:hypothetical protein
MRDLCADSVPGIAFLDIRSTDYDAIGWSITHMGSQRFLGMTSRVLLPIITILGSKIGLVRKILSRQMRAYAPGRFGRAKSQASSMVIPFMYRAFSGGFGNAPAAILLST